MSSTASQTPAYQPYGAIRERSNSLDPVSFLRRKSYDYTRALTDQSYGHRANVAGWEAGNRAAGAGITGGARESLINSALAGVGTQRAQEMGTLSAGYNATEAAGINADRDASMQRQSLQQQMMQAALSYAASGRGVTNEGLANTIAAIQRGDPNAFDWLISRDLAGGAGGAVVASANPVVPSPGAGGVQGGMQPEAPPTGQGYVGERRGRFMWNGWTWVQA